MSKRRPTCHPESKHFAIDLCKKCYYSQYWKKLMKADPEKIKEDHRESYRIKRMRDRMLALDYIYKEYKEHRLKSKGEVENG